MLSLITNQQSRSNLLSNFYLLMALEAEKLKSLWDECNLKHGRVTLAEIARRLGTTRKIIENRITSEKLSPTLIEIACELEKDFPGFYSEYIFSLIEIQAYQRTKYRQQYIDNFLNSLDSEEIDYVVDFFKRKVLEAIKSQKIREFYVE